MSNFVAQLLSVSLTNRGDNYFTMMAHNGHRNFITIHMQYKPGDKVRFLNEKGGGTVMKIINDFMVSVAIEDGFEIPTLTSNLVLVEQGNAPMAVFAHENQGKNVKQNIPAAAPDHTIDESYRDQDNRATPISKLSEKQAIATGVYLAYVPADQQWLVTGNIDIYLVNFTEHDTLYSLFLKKEDGGYSGIDYGILPKESKILIESIVHEDLNEWISGTVQILFHKDDNEKLLMPVSTDFRIKGSKFYREDSFHQFGLLQNKKAVIFTLCEINRIHSTVEYILTQKEGDTPVPEKAKQFRPEAIIDRYQTAPREAEVDLHISALRDRYDQLSPHEILTIQLGTFERMLESALACNYTRVIFIHGIGNGSLKQALIERIRNYGNIEFRNASFTRFGNGAIELILHQNL